MSALLRQAARGDVEAFMQFYDETSGPSFRLALARARLLGLSPGAVRAAAEHDTLARFVEAWRTAAEHETSGLSALAWLLTLDVSETGAHHEGAACA